LIIAWFYKRSVTQASFSIDYLYLTAFLLLATPSYLPKIVRMENVQMLLPMEPKAFWQQFSFLQLSTTLTARWSYPKYDIPRQNRKTNKGLKTRIELGLKTTKPTPVLTLTWV